MASALDSHKRRVSVAAIAAGHRDYAPRMIVMIEPGYLAPAVRAIHRRLEDVQHKQGIGAYVFIDDDMRAFVVTEQQSVAQAWVREHFRWLVGFYTRVKAPGIPLLLPTLEGLLEDIGEHVAELRAHRLAVAP